MSVVDQAILNAVTVERDAARAKCRELRQQLAAAEALVEGAAEAGAILDGRIKELEGKLAAAEALNAEAAKAGPIVDARIKELELQLVASRQNGVNLRDALSYHVSRNGQQAAEIEQLRHDLAASREAGGVPPVEQPEETELERRAWALFVASVAAAWELLAPAEAFHKASDWMDYRDERRKAGGT